MGEWRKIGILYELIRIGSSSNITWSLTLCWRPISTDRVELTLGTLELFLFHGGPLRCCMVYRMSAVASVVWSFLNVSGEGICMELNLLTVPCLVCLVVCHLKALCFLVLGTCNASGHRLIRLRET